MATGLTISITGLTVTCPTGITFNYIPYSGVCETVQNFEIRKTISNLWGPQSLWFDNRTTDSYGAYPNGRVWVADNSNYAGGNIYWFDPVTATTSSHMHYISGGTGQPILRTDTFYQTYIDTLYKRIYFTGYNNAGTDSVYGLVIYDMTTNTITHFHDNGSFTTGVSRRQLLYVTNDNIYVNTNNGILYYPRNNNIPTTSGFTSFDCVTNTFAQKHFCNSNSTGEIYGAFNFTQVSSSTINSPMIWVTACPSNGGNIGIMSTDLNNTFTDISLPGQATWASSKYWQFSFYDQQYNKFYVSDAGSNKYYIITPSSDNKSGTVQTFNINKLYLKGHDHVLIGWTIDPQSGKLYGNYYLYNGTNTTSVQTVVYELNRSNGTIKKELSLTNGVGNLQSVNDGNQYSLMGSEPSRTSGNGSITILNNTTNTGYTGLWYVKTMESVDPTHNNIKTGFYVSTAYTITDYSRCHITTGTTCPTYSAAYDSGTVYYDFNITQDIINTTGYTGINYYLYGNGTSITSGTVPMSYYSGGTPNVIYYYSNNVTTTNQGPYNMDFTYTTSTGTINCTT